MSKKVWIPIVAVLAFLTVAALMLGAFFLTRENAVEGTKNITVTVVHKDGTEKDFAYTTQEEHLGTVLLSEGLVEGEEGPYGLYIKVVDNEQAIYEEDGAYWALYVGEEAALTGADSTVIHDGDTFKLVYTLG